MHYDISTLQSSIARQLSDIYKPILINGMECFETTSGHIFFVEIFPGERALVIGHADSIQEAELYRFEDGDRFYMDEMGEREMLQAIIREIEG